MMPANSFFVDPELTRADRAVLRRLLDDAPDGFLRPEDASGENKRDSGVWSRTSSSDEDDAAADSERDG
jgi:hypothetical protein